MVTLGSQTSDITAPTHSLAHSSGGALDRKTQPSLGPGDCSCLVLALEKGHGPNHQ